MNWNYREQYRIWYRCLILLAVILVGNYGCASNLTEEEREWRAAIDLDNWVMCKKVYDQEHAYTVHVNHESHHRRRVSFFDIKSDLRVNDCAWILKDYWISY